MRKVKASWEGLSPHPIALLFFPWGRGPGPCRFSYFHFLGTRAIWIRRKGSWFSYWKSKNHISIHTFTFLSCHTFTKSWLQLVEKICHALTRSWLQLVERICHTFTKSWLQLVERIFLTLTTFWLQLVEHLNKVLIKACGKNLSRFNNVLITACGKNMSHFYKVLITACGKNLSHFNNVLITACGNNVSHFNKVLITACGKKALTSGSPGNRTGSSMTRSSGMLSLQGGGFCPSLTRIFVDLQLWSQCLVVSSGVY